MTKSPAKFTSLTSKSLFPKERFAQKYRGQFKNTIRAIICLNNEKKVLAKKKRDERLSSLKDELAKFFSNKDKKEDIIKAEKKLSSIFGGYKSRYQKFFTIERDDTTKKAIGFCVNQKVIEDAEEMDGIFILTTNRGDLDKIKVVQSYKNLKEVETLFDDLNNFVDINPFRHWLEVRVKAHAFLCILALLLKRIFEIDCLGGKCVMEPLEEISNSKLVKYNVKFSEREGRTKTFFKVTNTTANQKKYFNMVGITNPMNLENFVW